MNFEQHTISSAPESVKADLEAAEAAYGAIPNLFRGLASSPAALKMYLSFVKVLAEHGHLSPVEQQVVYISVSAQNGCNYCVSVHSVLATMAKIPTEILDELRKQKELSDPKLNALRNFALAMLDKKGWVSDQVLADFSAAGYDQRHVLEVITIMAQKTLSNYFNHIAQTPLDDMFKSMEWETQAA